MFAILSGLGHGSVSRLKQTWDKLPAKYVKMFEVRKGKEKYLYSAICVLCISQSARAYVRPSVNTKFFYFNEIWHVDGGR